MKCPICKKYFHSRREKNYIEEYKMCRNCYEVINDHVVQRAYDEWRDQRAEMVTEVTSHDLTGEGF